MILSQWILFASTVFLTTLTPGPATLLSITHGVSHGKIGAFYTTLGCITATTLMAVFSIIGLGLVISTSKTIYMLIHFIGGAYIVWLGLKQYTNRKEKFFIQTNSPNKVVRGTYRKIYWDVFFVSASNPKAIIFFGTIFPIFLDVNDNIHVQFSIMIATFIVLSFGFIFGYGAIASYILPWLQKPNIQENFKTMTSCLFVLIGRALITIAFHDLL